MVLLCVVGPSGGGAYWWFNVYERIWPQVIAGSVVDTGVPVAGRSVRFGALKFLSKPCVGDHLLEVHTDAEGRFVAPREVKQDWRRVIGLTGPADQFCISDGEGWWLLWNLPYGTDPSRIEVECDLAGAHLLPGDDGLNGLDIGSDRCRFRPIYD
ncbi:MAG: hypothetical protein OXU20_38350 [Myxococcales bacterium]|nr:hypothetical protein [Myxococcales bacterium]